MTGNFRTRSTRLALGLSFAAAGALGASSASAMPIAGNGEVLGIWQVTPFTGPAAPAVVVDGHLTSIYQNNWSPINYPGIGHQPSPGGVTGERFDLEEMHLRQTGSTLHFLLVRSSPFAACVGSTTYLLGDLLLDTDGDGQFDAGVVSQSATHGLVAGGLYTGIQTDRLMNVPGSYRGTQWESLIGPWGVQSGFLVGQFDLDTEDFNYAGEGNTWITEFALDLRELELGDGDILNFQIAWGCGNDVLRGTYTVLADTPTPPPPQPPITPAGDTVVPEPATSAMGLAGLIAAGLAALRRRRD